ncbi:hypothetical protein Tco_1401716 [Tanacetum coccineum]
MVPWLKLLRIRNNRKDLIKMCLEYEEKDGEKLVKRELLVALRGEFYFVKFIINPEERDVEPSVILGRSFMRLAKVEDDYELMFDGVNFGDVLELDKVVLPPFEEPAREALAIDTCKRFSILEEERPVIETMTYSDMYKKILDEIVMDKFKLDGEIKKEEEEAIKQVKGDALIEKEDLRAFVIPIRLEAKISLNALADTEAEPMRVLKDVLCQVGVTTIIMKFLILDMLVDRDTPILVGRGFLYTCGSILNTRDRITSTFDGVYHQTFCAAKTSLNTKESNSDDEEEYGIKRNRFGAPMYGPKPAKYLDCNDLMDRALALQEVINPFRKVCVWKKAVSFLGSLLVPL